MPRAAQDLAPPQIPVLTRGARDDESAEHPLAQRSALMRTGVAEREELTADIEYAYRPALERHDAAAAGRDLCGCCYPVLQFSGSPYSALALEE
jgi:hypothetical protein